ncbi:MAG: LysO family transporter [Muribaculaceae bacterium]|nr:LysO family transporter [Muribaculaceae bacterium]MBQ3911006.1 LysO family transporter [Muribaculaceae bacterium]MBQ6648247.1 LysO family transporter [Muribaculaceae bacterium]
MIEIISIMVAGIAVGWLLRKHSFKIVGVVLIVLVWALLFFLGIEVGENEKIIGSLQNLGLEALLLSVAATAGSIACAWALWRYIQRKEGCNQ